MVGCLSPAEQGQLEDLEKAVHVLKSYLAEPSALHIHRRENVFLLVRTIVVGRFDFLSRGVGFGASVETKQVINKRVIKQLFT